MPLTRPACSNYSISKHALRIYDTEGSLGYTLTIHDTTESRTPRRGFHLPQPAAHVRDRTLQPAQAPEDRTVLARHTSYTQTMDTYSHLLEYVDQDEVGGLDGAFG